MASAAITCRDGSRVRFNGEAIPHADENGE
jgi:hypothetical protein